MPLRDHVSKHGKKLVHRAEKLYSVTPQDFKNALFGTPEQVTAAAKKFGQVGIESALVLKMLPQIKEAYLKNIEATTQYNQAQAEILKATGNSAIAIDRARISTSIAQKQYTNKWQEMTAEWVVANSLEKQRHQFQKNYIQLKALVEHSLNRTDNEAKIIEQSLRPTLKQRAEDLNYRDKEIQHYLTNGDNSDTSLIHRKEYVNDNPVRRLAAGIGEKLGLLF